MRSKLEVERSETCGLSSLKPRRILRIASSFAVILERKRRISKEDAHSRMTPKGVGVAIILTVHSNAFGFAVAPCVILSGAQKGIMVERKDKVPVRSRTFFTRV